MTQKQIERSIAVLSLKLLRLRHKHYDVDTDCMLGVSLFGARTVTDRVNLDLAHIHIRTEDILNAGISGTRKAPIRK